MHWKRKVRFSKGAFADYSLSKKLKKEGKSSDEFEFYIGKLTLEELIALKLEVSSRMLGGKMYGFNIWSAMPRMAKDAVLLYAISVSNTLEDAATMMNMSTSQLISILEIYKSRKYYDLLKQDLTGKKT